MEDEAGKDRKETGRMQGNLEAGGGLNERTNIQRQRKAIENKERERDGEGKQRDAIF
jgi:hypothetical protein